jgi:hypothetical protein
MPFSSASLMQWTPFWSGKRMSTLSKLVRRFRRCLDCLVFERFSKLRLTTFCPTNRPALPTHRTHTTRAMKNGMGKESTTYVLPVQHSLGSLLSYSVVWVPSRLKCALPCYRSSIPSPWSAKLLALLFPHRHHYTLVTLTKVSLFGRRATVLLQTLGKLVVGIAQ